jgi:hypothetical protein
VLAGTIALLLIVPYSIVGLSAPADRSVRIFHNTAYPHETEIAAYVAATTVPDDRIFVAFNDAAIYYLSGRVGAYPYLFNQELLAFPTAESDLIFMVSGPDRPEVIVATGMPSPFADGGAAFWQAVGGYFRVEATVGPAVIYRAIEVTPRRFGLEAAV